MAEIDRRDAMKLLAAAPLAASALADAATATPPWNELSAQLGSRFRPVISPLAECAKAGGAGADALFAKLKNPYYLGDEAGLTQTLGWTDAWTSRPSSHVVAAESAADVAAAICFAAKHRVRLAVKGGGHSYYGNSNAADSLLIWTRPMQATAMHDAFVPQGAPAGTAPVPAMSVGAGCLWGRVYAEAVRHGRYVQGGGCLTVGVAGFATGGGFGSLSKAFGTGAGNLVEAEVVTADGRIRIANAWCDPDLFFALRGGGGATFGVVRRLTFRTFDLPTTIGAVQFGVTAATDAAWKRLVARTIAFYAEALFDPHWGEQIRFSPRRRLSIAMMFQGLTQDAARAVWKPFLDWVAADPELAIKGDPLILAVPAAKFWDPAFLRSVPGVVAVDDRSGASPDNVFWSGNVGEAGQVLHAYQSAWMPAALLAPARQSELVDTMIAASAVWSVTFHCNKGMAGGAADAKARVGETATNPEVLDAFALLICAAEGPPGWPDIPGHEPDLALGREEAKGVAGAMVPIRKLVPDAGAYVSEADYFDRDWQRAYWGVHYPRLLAAKRRYDPGGLFVGHHLVGG